MDPKRRLGEKKKSEKTEISRCVPVTLLKRLASHQRQIAIEILSSKNCRPIHYRL